MPQINPSKVLSPKNPLSRIEWLCKQGETLLYADPETALAYGMDALNLVEQHQNMLGKARALALIGGVHIVQGNFNSVLDYLNQALQLYSNLKNTLGMAGCYNRIASLYFIQGHYEASLTMYQRAQRLYEQDRGEPLSYTKVLGNIGILYVRHGDYSTALEYHLKALSIYQRFDNQAGIASIFHHLAALYYEQGNLQMAQEYNFRALSIEEQQGNLLRVAYLLTNIATTYVDLKKNDQAITYETKAIDIKNRLNNPHMLADSYTTLGLAYEGLQKYTKSLDYHLQALTIRQEVGDNNGQLISILNIGNIYNQLGHYTSSIDILKKGVELSEQQGQPRLKSDALARLAWAYLKLNQLEIALDTGLAALTIAQEIQATKQIQYAAEWLCQIYEQQGDYQHAVEYLRLAKQTSEARLNTENTRQLNQMQMQYEAQKKEQELSHLHQELILHKKELKTIAFTVIHQHELLFETKKKLTDILANPSSKKKLREFMHWFENQIDPDRTWVQFQRYFKQDQHDFLNRLTEEFPSLTEQQLKICVLIRSEFHTKEIARLLYITEQSVRKHRQRIRRKLHLEKKRSLSVFLVSY